MSSIPLAVNPPAAPIDPIQQAGQALTLQNLIQGIRERQQLMPGQLQAQQQQLQGQQQANESGALDLQLKQQQLKDQAAIGNILWGGAQPQSSNNGTTPAASASSSPSTAMPEPDPDRFVSKLAAIQASPDISPKGKLDFTNQLTEMQQKRATLDATTLANEEKVMGMVGSALTSVANAAPEDQPAQYTLQRNAMLRNPLTAQMAQQIPAQYAGPDQLKADIQRYTTIRDMTEWTKQQNEGPGQQAESQQKVQNAKAPTPEQIQNATKTLSSYAAIPAPERAGLQAEMQAAPDWETLQKIQARADASQQANQLHQDTLANTRAIMGNKFGEAGLTANEKIWTDPQRGYAGALAQANQTKASIVAGADGNGLLTNLVPTMEVLGVNHAAGINRISPQEAIAAGTNPEWATRWNAWVTKAATGKLTPEMATQGRQLMDIVTDAAYNRSIQSSQLIARGHQLTPDQVPAMNRDGSLTTLDKVSPGASSGPKPSAGPAAGMTRIKASDGAIYDIPSQNLFKARRRDPQLQVVQSGGGAGTSGGQSTAAPSLLDKLKGAGEAFVGTIPGVGLVHQAAGAVQDWANREMSPDNPEMLSPAKTFGTGVVRDVAGLVKGATSPEGLATTAATIAAPEVMGPALVGHGVYSAVKGWGDLKNPDVLQGELNAGAEVAGGAAVTGSAIKAGGGPVTQAVRQKVNPPTQLPAQAAQDLQNAIPASKSAPYADIDMQKARPYLEAEHVTTPIDSVQGLRDAADSAIGKIEDGIEQKISQLPPVRFKTNVTQDVTQALQTNQRGQAFVDAGLKDLEDFHFDQSKTLADADAIRRQLNLENQAVLAQNGYKVAVARASDPAFAAREAAAESLRDGIYKQLAANGLPEAQSLRLDEGSLIKLRNAAQNQIFNGDKVVRSTAQSGPVRQAAKAVTKSGATAAGAAVAGWPGAIVGREVGESLGNAFTPEGLSRDALIGRSFAKPVASSSPQATPAPASLPAAAVSTAAAQSPSSAASLRDLVSGRLVTQ